MDNEQLMVIADIWLKTAQSILMLEKVLYPFIIAVTENDVVCHPYDIPEEEAQDMNELLKKTSENKKALILLLDGYIYDVKDGDIPEDIKTHPDTVESLVCVVFTEKFTRICQISYTRDSNEVGGFSNKGWSDLKNAEHNFYNPFKETAL